MKEEKEDTMNSSYQFSCEDAFNNIKKSWKDWNTSTFGKKNPKKWIVGISGGKDSTVVAALACKIFGKKNVIGVSLPCDGQKDMEDVNLVFETLKIKRHTIDIGDANHSILAGMENTCIDIHPDTKINLQARLRMAALYAVAQSVDGVVLCTANLSESVVGFATLYGDHAGSYAPIWDYTVSEVIALGKWLGLPDALVDKTPIDGLQPLTDEEKLGMTYSDIDKCIREDKGSSELKKKVLDKFMANKFKMEIVNIPHPDSGLLNEFDLLLKKM